MARLLRPSPDAGLFVLRLGLAVIVLFHGVYKVSHGVEWMRGILGAHGLPFFLAYGTYVAEVAAPALLLLGAATRLAGLVIAFDMVGAVYLARPSALTQIGGGGGWAIEVEAMIFIMALAVALAGPGRYRLVKTQPPWE